MDESSIPSAPSSSNSMSSIPTKLKSLSYGAASRLSCIASHVRESSKMISSRVKRDDVTEKESVTNSNTTVEGQEQETADNKWGYSKEYCVAAASGLGALALVSGGICALGFGPAGIAAGSIGAKMMSASATYGYGATVVGGLQSVGAAGMALTTKAAVVATGGAASYKAIKKN